MDNQHKLIKGYRDLSQDEINLINEAKSLAETVGLFVKKLEDTKLNISDDNINLIYNVDPRWLAIGKTDLQKGFMEIIRSIAQPETFSPIPL